MCDTLPPNQQLSRGKAIDECVKKVEDIRGVTTMDPESHFCNKNKCNCFREKEPPQKRDKHSTRKKVPQIFFRRTLFIIVLRKERNTTVERLFARRNAVEREKARASDLQSLRDISVVRGEVIFNFSSAARRREPERIFL